MLKDTEHNGFPILSSDSKLKGLISRHTLIVLMRELDRIPNFIGERLNVGPDHNQELSWLDFTNDFETTEAAYSSI